MSGSETFGGDLFLVCFFHFLAARHGLFNLSSPIRDGTQFQAVVLSTGLPRDSLGVIFMFIICGGGFMGVYICKNLSNCII